MKQTAGNHRYVLHHDLFHLATDFCYDQHSIELYRHLQPSLKKAKPFYPAVSNGAPIVPRD